MTKIYAYRHTYTNTYEYQRKKPNEIDAAVFQAKQRRSNRLGNLAVAGGYTHFSKSNARLTKIQWACCSPNQNSVRMLECEAAAANTRRSLHQHTLCHHSLLHIPTHSEDCNLPDRLASSLSGRLTSWRACIAHGSVASHLKECDKRYFGNDTKVSKTRFPCWFLIYYAKLNNNSKIVCVFKATSWQGRSRPLKVCS